MTVTDELRWVANCDHLCQCCGGEECCRHCPERIRELCHRFRLCRRGMCLCSDMDTVLMAAFADGDDRAFDALYQRNLDGARKLALRFVGNWQDACDIAQDAFLRVIAHRHRWRPTAKFQAWFYRIVVNLSLKRCNRSTFVTSLSDGAEAEEGAAEEPAVLVMAEDPEKVLLAAEEAGQLHWALEQLPKRQQQALWLWAQGASYQQIAQHLGCSLSAVETLLHRAKRNLRKRMVGKPR